MVLIFIPLCFSASMKSCWPMVFWSLWFPLWKGRWWRTEAIKTMSVQQECPPSSNISLSSQVARLLPFYLVFEEHTLCQSQISSTRTLLENWFTCVVFCWVFHRCFPSLLNETNILQEAHVLRFMSSHSFSFHLFVKVPRGRGGSPARFHRVIYIVSKPYWVELMKA